MTDKPTLELLPCPFCGEQVEIVEREKLFVFRCPESSPCFGSGMATYGKLDQRETAVTAWNTRSDNTQSKQIERLREALRPFARFFKSEDHNLSPASDNTPVALFKDQRTGEPLAELWIGDFRKAAAAFTSTEDRNG